MNTEHNIIVRLYDIVREKNPAGYVWLGYLLVWK